MDGWYVLPLVLNLFCIKPMTEPNTPPLPETGVGWRSEGLIADANVLMGPGRDNEAKVRRLPRRPARLPALSLSIVGLMYEGVDRS